MIHLLVLGLYLGALLLWVRLLLSGARGGEGSASAAAVAAVAVATHAAALAWFRVDQGELPLVGPGAALSSLAFVGGLALVALLLARPVSRVGVVLLPFIVACQGAAVLVGIAPSARVLTHHGAGFVAHVVFAFIGVQALALAAAAGTLYLAQHHELKAKRMGRVFHFTPPLATLDLVGQIGAWIGFIALTLAIGFGWAWAARDPGVVIPSDSKFVWVLIAWAVFPLILLPRVRGGRREYLGALAAIVGFVVVLGAYLILRLAATGGGLLP